MEREYQGIKDIFSYAERLMFIAISRRPLWSIKLGESFFLFGQFCKSWFDQAREFMAVETLKSYDLASNSSVSFLSETELREIEKRFEVGIKDIISKSYEQESRNTKLVREQNPSYNPYSHEKISDADGRIRDLIGGLDEVRDVLDFGCDDGRRTLRLFGGSRLYGIELAETGVEEAKKRGIDAYRGSMIDDVYRNEESPDGRQFDLVSIVGEMVNFVGPETDAMLARAAEQTRKEGYLLVTAMHPAEAIRSEEGKYVIWSHTKSTRGKWLLEESKVPRTFLLMSEQGLHQRMEGVAHDLGCNFSLQGSRKVEDYYEDMPLGIYLFRKN
jgi:SAM-dependent methyltransferase